MLLQNILKITFRSIRKDRAYSIINVAGLTIGITCSLFILMYILHETSYDRYHQRADSIYRIVTTIQEPDNNFTWSVAQIPLADELVSNYPEVKHAVRFYEAGHGVFKNGEKQFYEDNFYLADSAVFQMFTYDFIEGHPATALTAPNSIVLTKSIALKYFEDISSCLGLSIQNQYGEEFKITGIIEDVPVASHFRFDALISKTTLPDLQGSWGTFGVYTYIELPEHYPLEKMYDILAKVIREKIQPEFEKSHSKISYQLQRITDIHLHSKVEDESEAGGDISYIYIFATIGIFILVMASINYMNLATARSMQRAKEVGVRKVLGSRRTQLFLQFITESIVITLLSLVLSIVCIAIFLPLFNDLANKQIPFYSLFHRDVLMGLGCILFFLGIVGGSYPALYLSGFNPSHVLKGKLSSQRGNVKIQSALVVVQFSISIFMLIATMLVFNQLNYIRTKDLGFAKDKIIRLSITEFDLQQKVVVLTERLKQLPEVSSVGFASTSPGKRIGKLLFEIEDNDGKLLDRSVNLFFADFDFIKTMEMALVQGRDFSRNSLYDTAHAVIVNEAMVKRMGWTNPLGKKIFSAEGNGTRTEKHVIGVIKDYHQNSLYGPIEPIMIVLKPVVQYIFVRVDNANPQMAVKSIETTWKSIFNNNSFQYTFLDQDFNSQYKLDERRQNIFALLTLITIVIAAMGLLGLAAFTTQMRYKEIGVRKILGAETNGLVLLISKDFISLIIISILLACPAAWFFTDHWLQNFAFRIALVNHWLTFVLSAASALLITMLAVGYHVVMATLINPVHALRDE